MVRLEIFDDLKGVVVGNVPEAEDVQNITLFISVLGPEGMVSGSVDRDIRALRNRIENIPILVIVPAMPVDMLGIKVST